MPKIIIRCDFVILLNKEQNILLFWYSESRHWHLLQCFALKLHLVFITVVFSVSWLQRFCSGLKARWSVCMVIFLYPHLCKLRMCVHARWTGDDPLSPSSQPEASTFYFWTVVERRLQSGFCRRLLCCDYRLWLWHYTTTSCVCVAVTQTATAEVEAGGEKKKMAKCCLTLKTHWAGAVNSV